MAKTDNLTLKQAFNYFKTKLLNYLSPSLVPTALLSDAGKYLKSDGTWDFPPGTSLVTIQLDTVSNSSGSYSHTTYTDQATSSMQAVRIECTNSAAFLDEISITIDNGSVTLTCASVSGTSAVSVVAFDSSGTSGGSSGGGSSGSSSAIIDDTAGVGDKDVVWSADKTAKMIARGNSIIDMTVRELKAESAENIYGLTVNELKME